jgi:amino acid transporter
MEIFITITTFLLLGLILIFPILILKRLKKNILLNYSLISLFIVGLLIVVFAWWSHKSDLILLNNFGYNIDGMNHNEFYENVSSENMEKVKSLETSIMGIGWPLKAIFGFVIFLPYLIFVYIGKNSFDKVKNKKALLKTE